MGLSSVKSDPDPFQDGPDPKPPVKKPVGTGTVLNVAYPKALNPIFYANLNSFFSL
jgi:hypothetical protein